MEYCVYHDKENEIIYLDTQCENEGRLEMLSQNQINNLVFYLIYNKINNSDTHKIQVLMIYSSSSLTIDEINQFYRQTLWELCEHFEVYFFQIIFI